jgi:sulfopyruvate decarboxylase subunit beta
MHPVEAIKEFIKLRDDAAVIVGPTKNAGVLYNEGHQPATIYNMELGYASAIALGLALATPEQKVVALEGDGSMIAGIGVLSTVALQSPSNLVILLFDNDTYGSIGEGDCESATASGLSLPNIARASGFDKVLEANDLETLGSKLAIAMAEAGPWLVYVKTDRYGPDLFLKPPLPGQDIVESVVFFRREMMARGYVHKD